ncbi:glycosyltransferase family 2 protein [Porcipelethomonas sp.]|uniref:glycosyltransferase family 2 protein n=1 Tax=Porcipelethomonas sp. TaxID=2981675 RepID=UPI003EF42940
MNKVLSVIIPSYNSRKWLKKCLNSFVCNVINDIEVIVVNDGSDDGSENIAMEFINKYPGSFSLKNKENGGHGSAINEGVRLASGKYIKVIDADDWINTQSLPAFINALKNMNTDTVLTHYRTINETDGAVKCWRTYPQKFGIAYTLDSIMSDWKSFDRGLTFHGITYNREFYMKNSIKLSEHIFYEDHEYAAIPCCFSEGVVPLDLFIYEYRIGDSLQSVSSDNQVRRISHIKAVLERLVKERSILDKYSADSGNIKYYNAKIYHLLLSFLLTSLVYDSDKRGGRKYAAEYMNYMKESCPDVYNSAVNHYRIMKVMNYLHISEKTYRKILDSAIYNKFRNNHDFL